MCSIWRAALILPHPVIRWLPKAVRPSPPLLDSPTKPNPNSGLTVACAQQTTPISGADSPPLPINEHSPLPYRDIREVRGNSGVPAPSRWAPQTPQPNPPLPPRTEIDPVTDTCAIVVLTNLYMFRTSEVPIDMVRRILRLDRTTVLLNRRVIIAEQSALSNQIANFNTPEDDAVDLITFARLTEILSTHLRDRFCVFHDREAALNAVRFALPREHTCDLATHIHLRNDALREEGTVLCRSRLYIALLKLLWRPILDRVVPVDPIEKARGLIELFDGISHLFRLKPIACNSTWTLAGDWYSNFSRSRELSESLHLERERTQQHSVAHSEIRRRSHAAVEPAATNLFPIPLHARAFTGREQKPRTSR